MHWILERVKKTRKTKKRKRSKSLDNTENQTFTEVKESEKTKSLPDLPTVVLEVPSPDHSRMPTPIRSRPLLSRASSMRVTPENILFENRMSQRTSSVSKSMRDFGRRQNTIAGSTAYSRNHLNLNLSPRQPQLNRSSSCRSPPHQLGQVCQHARPINQPGRRKPYRSQTTLNRSQQALYSPTFFTDWSEPSTPLV